jgi:hypothetical protein
MKPAPGMQAHGCRDSESNISQSRWHQDLRKCITRCGRIACKMMKDGKSESVNMS